MKQNNQVGRLSARESLAHIVNQYRVTTRMNRRKSKKYTLATIEEIDGSFDHVDTNNDDKNDSIVIKHQLVEIQC